MAERGLKRLLLILCLLLNVPNVTFLYLGWFQPESIYIIGLISCIEKLGWGIGAVGHMVYMMQQIAPGRYKMTRYAFATGFGLSLCMTLGGAFHPVHPHGVLPPRRRGAGQVALFAL